jgi:hypothetical protein
MNKPYWASPEDIINSPRYPFSKGQLRHYLAMRHRNGLGKAVRKIGKRLYLRTDLLDLWIESNAHKEG